MRISRASALVLAVALAAVTLSACSDDGDAPTAHNASTHDTASAEHGEHLMNDHHAMPADEIEGADLRTGRFELLDTAPPGSDDVAGRVWLAENDNGTTVTTRLTGLAPGEDYMLHLHEQVCSDDAGGGHFMFDPEGEEIPPNEVHLAFTADDTGAGEATVTNDRKVGEGARSIVIHPSAAMDNRVACADL